ALPHLCTNSRRPQPMQEQQPSLTASNQPDQPDQPTEQSQSSPETMPSLHDMLKQAELQAQEHYDAWLRDQAESGKGRKRAQADKPGAQKYAIETFASQLLPVRDSLEAALAAENSSPEALRQGVELTLKQLESAFDKSTVREINPLGEKFDPHKHQAMT